MNDYFHAYSGGEPYIFVSYSHKDSSRVYPILSQLHREGYRIWYDEGITPTDEWRGVINEHIRDCAVFMVFVTGDSMASHEVIKECTYAINLRKKLHIIYLEKVPDSRVNANLIADFTNSQRVHAHELHSSVFSIKLREPLAAFRDANAEAETGAQAETVTDRTARADTGREQMSIQRLWDESMKKKTPVWLAVVFAAAVAVVFIQWIIVQAQWVIPLSEIPQDEPYAVVGDFLWNIFIVIINLLSCAFPISAAVMLFYMACKNKKPHSILAEKDVKSSNIMASVCSLTAPFTYFSLYSFMLTLDAPLLSSTALIALSSIAIVIASRPIYKLAVHETARSVSESKMRISRIGLGCGLAVLGIVYLFNFSYMMYSIAPNWYNDMLVLVVTAAESLIALFIHHSYYASLLGFGKKVSDLVPEK